MLVKTKFRFWALAVVLMLALLTLLAALGPGAHRVAAHAPAGSSFLYLPLLERPPLPGMATPRGEFYGGYDEQLGNAAVIDGDTVVVGASNADQETGAAYVYVRSSDGSWSQVKRLQSPDGSIEDQFGIEVAIDGDLIVVADWRNGLQGAVHIFERNTGGADNWGHVKTIIAPEEQTDDLFGVSLAIQGETLVVGALYADREGADIHADHGAVYIFERHQDGTDNWGLVKKLMAHDDRDYAHFGRTVALDGDILVVNADYTMTFDGSSTYVFQRHEGGTNNWGLVQQFTGSDAGVTEDHSDHYGWSVALDGDLLAIGADWTDVDSIDRQGLVYLFAAQNKARTQWAEVAKLTMSDGDPAQDEFGRSISLSGDLLAIGAPDATYANRPYFGVTYLFLRSADGTNVWTNTATLGLDVEDQGPSFGFAVDADGERLVVGAPNRDTMSSLMPGAAYFYEVVLP